MGKGSEINQIWEALQADEEANVTRLPENVFLASFLPFFAGEPARTDLNMEVSIGTWIAIAGGPFREVAVVNPTNGDELFRVPPMMEIDGIQVSDRREISVRDAIQNMMNLSNVSPVRAKAYFQDRMMTLGLQQDPSQFADKYVEAWNKIFARYNRPLLTTVAKLQEKVAAGQVARTQSLVVGDDDLL
jgi:hypothetical protein